jgi:hypothetical protein
MMFSSGWDLDRSTFGPFRGAQVLWPLRLLTFQRPSPGRLPPARPPRISPGKYVDFRLIRPPHFAPSLRRRGAGLLQGEAGPPGLRFAMQARPLRKTCQAVSVRQAEALPPASFRTRPRGGPLALGRQFSLPSLQWTFTAWRCPCRAHIARRTGSPLGAGKGFRHASHRIRAARAVAAAGGIPRILRFHEPDAPEPPCGPLGVISCGG